MEIWIRVRLSIVRLRAIEKREISTADVLVIEKSYIYWIFPSFSSENELTPPLSYFSLPLCGIIIKMLRISNPKVSPLSSRKGVSCRSFGPAGSGMRPELKVSALVLLFPSTNLLIGPSEAFQ